MKEYKGTTTPKEIRDSWRTPREIFDFYDRRFCFKTDLAASHDNKLCQRYFTIDNSAFNVINREAILGHVWCNPPYSNITPWVDLCISIATDDHRKVVMLLPADTSVKWFKLAFENCTECHFISGRLTFINEQSGKPVNGNNKGSVVFVFDGRSPVKQHVVLLNRDEMK
jgi:phage N-6-adenine-methyltransferase